MALARVGPVADEDPAVRAGVDGDAVLLSLPDLALSSGSACNSTGIPGSHVLKAIGLNADLVQSSLRFGLGRFTTDEEVDYAAARVMEAVRKLRNAVPRT